MFTEYTRYQYMVAFFYIMRPSRTDIENTYHHIIVRGINRLPIFKNDKDKNLIIYYLRKYLKIYDIMVLSYIIMNNHLHLLIKRFKDSMGDFMHDLLTAYAVYYNNEYNRTGHVYEGRYKSILVDFEEYFLVLIRYIHQNSVRANIVNEIKDYKWSSYHEFTNQNKNKSKMITNIDYVLNLLSSNRKESLIIFHNIINENVNKEIIKPVRVRNHLILGNERYIENWMQILKSETRELAFERQRLGERELNVLVKHLLEKYSLHEEIFYSNSKCPNAVKAKQLFIYLKKKYFHSRLFEIANELNISNKSVSRNLNIVLNDSKIIKEAENVMTNVYIH